MLTYQKYIRILVSLCVLGWAECAYAQGQKPPQEEPEIVIEIIGQPDKPSSSKDDIVIWDKNAKQLARLLHGKTRDEALHKITSVSSRDRTVTAANAVRYRLVQYGTENNAYRLLFLAKEPQTFVACAVGTRETLELALRYRVVLDMTENEFLEAYAQHVSSVFLPIENGQSLYRLDLPGKSPQFLLFEKRNLSRLFTKTEADRLVEDQQATLRKQEKYTPPATKHGTVTRSRTVLIEGGTLHDRLYMPRLANPQDFPDLPHLVPSDIPAGTPLWPQEIIPQ